jgi:hypothetical protein
MWFEYTSIANSARHCSPMFPVRVENGTGGVSTERQSEWIGVFYWLYSKRLLFFDICVIK